jgi:hypothetical protein
VNATDAVPALTVLDNGDTKIRGTSRTAKLTALESVEPRMAAPSLAVTSTL